MLQKWLSWINSQIFSICSLLKLTGLSIFLPFRAGGKMLLLKHRKWMKNFRKLNQTNWIWCSSCAIFVQFSQVQNLNHLTFFFYTNYGKILWTWASDKNFRVNYAKIFTSCHFDLSYIITQKAFKIFSFYIDCGSDSIKFFHN